MKGPLKSGANNYYEKGICWFPDISVSEGYAKYGVLQIPMTTGTKKFIYVFQCRVNVKAVHNHENSEFCVFIPIS
jgi:hypothetical protein